MMNLSISEYFTFVLNKKRIVICEDSRELVNQIMRIGNNINQIAAVANKNRYISDHSISEVKGMVEECRDSLIEFISFIYESEPDYTQNDSVKNAIILEEIVPVETPKRKPGRPRKPKTETEKKEKKTTRKKKA